MCCTMTSHTPAILTFSGCKALHGRKASATPACVPYASHGIVLLSRSRLCPHLAEWCLVKSLLLHEMILRVKVQSELAITQCLTIPKQHEAGMAEAVSPNSGPGD